MRPLFIAELQCGRPCPGCGAKLPLVRVSASMRSNALVADALKHVLVSLVCPCGTALMVMSERVPDETPLQDEEIPR